MRFGVILVVAWGIAGFAIGFVISALLRAAGY